MEPFVSVAWQDQALVMIDQRLLPANAVYNRYTRVEEVAEAITTMVVRGAPAIACAGAYGVALAAQGAQEEGFDATKKATLEACTLLKGTRPTAVNLFWALERISKVANDADQQCSGTDLAERILEEAHTIREQDIKTNQQLSRHGATLLPNKCHVLTHCNTGALATAGVGTALGVIRAAKEQGKQVKVIADETRPLLQGARLTAWELVQEQIDVTVVADSAAAALMRAGKVDLAIVGADRVAANGDVANKIGTYSAAVLCRHHGVPFYVAAPTTTIDLSTPSGEAIPIEERDPSEVSQLGDRQLVAEGAKVKNLAFDVTPESLVTAIITEEGIARPPYVESLAKMVGKSSEQKVESRSRGLPGVRTTPDKG